MGFKVPELTANKKTPLAAGNWDVQLTKFVSGTNGAGDKDYVQPVWKITEEGAVDTDDQPFTGRLYGDKFWQTGPAMWRFKKFAEEASVELPDANTEFDSVEEYAAALNQLFAGTEAVAKVVVRGYTPKDSDKERFTNDIEEYTFS